MRPVARALDVHEDELLILAKQIPEAVMKPVIPRQTLLSKWPLLIMADSQITSTGWNPGR